VQGSGESEDGCSARAQSRTVAIVRQKQGRCPAVVTSIRCDLPGAGCPRAISRTNQIGGYSCPYDSRFNSLLNELFRICQVIVEILPRSGDSDRHQTVSFTCRVRPPCNCAGSPRPGKKTRVLWARAGTLLPGDDCGQNPAVPSPLANLRWRRALMSHTLGPIEIIGGPLFVADRSGRVLHDHRYLTMGFWSANGPSG